MKRPPTHTRGGHDRWLISYADLVTLLLAVFTTLYAASTIDEQKLAPLSSSIREAFDASETPRVPGDAPAIVPPVAVVATQPRQDLQARLAQDLAQAIERDRIRMHRDARGLILTLPEEAAFGVGSSDVSGEA